MRYHGQVNVGAGRALLPQRKEPFSEHHHEDTLFVNGLSITLMSKAKEIGFRKAL
jgi:hypothetical protein